MFIMCPSTSDPEGVLPHKVFQAGEEMEFLAGLDFLVLGLPLTKATEGLIGEKELRALPFACLYSQSGSRPPSSRSRP